MLKIKNRRHFDTAEEIVNELLDKIQKTAAEAEAIYRGKVKVTETEKAKYLEHKQTQIATLSDFLNNELGYDIRLDDGMLFTSFYFNRVFYFRQMAEIEARKAADTEESV